MRLRPYWLVLLPMALTACGGGGGGFGPDPEPLTTAAVVATRAPDFSSGAVSLVQVDPPFAAQNELPPNDTSDIVVRSGGDHYFVIQRFGSNRVLRFEADAPATPVYSYSTQDSGDVADSNPADLLSVSPTKGYLLRYGSGTLWIVNPSAVTEAQFKIGEIDLSHYDPDGVPEMTSALIRDGRLYVVLQRLEPQGFELKAVRNGYLAVIDTQTDAEIEQGTDTEDLPGIELPLRNPGGVTQIPDAAALLVQASGGGSFDQDFNFTPDLNGGIARVDLGASSAELMIDDGTPGDAPFGGQIVGLAVTAADRAYLVGSTGFFGTQTLYRFDSDSAAPVPVAVPEAQGIEIGDVAADGLGRLWIGRTESSSPGLMVLDVTSETETVVTPLIDTVLTPMNIDFLSSP